MSTTGTSYVDSWHSQLKAAIQNPSEAWLGQSIIHKLISEVANSEILLFQQDHAQGQLQTLICWTQVLQQVKALAKTPMVLVVEMVAAIPLQIKDVMGWLNKQQVIEFMSISMESTIGSPPSYHQSGFSQYST